VLANDLGGGYLLARFEQQNPFETCLPRLNGKGKTGQGASHNNKVSLQFVHRRDYRSPDAISTVNQQYLAISDIWQSATYEPNHSEWRLTTNLLWVTDLISESVTGA
jgi:hypothetical protein